MIKRLENSTGKAKKAKNRSGTPDPVKLHGAPLCNLQLKKNAWQSATSRATGFAVRGGFPRHAQCKAPQTETATRSAMGRTTRIATHVDDVVGCHAAGAHGEVRGVPHSGPCVTWRGGPLCLFFAKFFFAFLEEIKPNSKPKTTARKL